MPVDTNAVAQTTILRRKDLAQRLGVSTVTVWRMRHELPPSIRLSKGIRGWRESDIASWLKSREGR